MHMHLPYLFCWGFICNSGLFSSFSLVQLGPPLTSLLDSPDCLNALHKCEIQSDTAQAELREESAWRPRAQGGVPAIRRQGRGAKTGAPLKPGAPNDFQKWNTAGKEEWLDLFCMLNVTCNLYSSECLIKSDRKMKAHCPSPSVLLFIRRFFLG